MTLATYIFVCSPTGNMAHRVRVNLRYVILLNLLEQLDRYKILFLSGSLPCIMSCLLTGRLALWVSFSALSLGQKSKRALYKSGLLHITTSFKGPQSASMESASAAEALFLHFTLQKILNQGSRFTPFSLLVSANLAPDQAGRRITLLGTINSENALLTLERAAFPSSPEAITALRSTLTNVNNLGANDIYAWYLANTQPSVSVPDLKINLIFPCTSAHIKKYSPQITRVVTETPSIYRTYVRPYIQRKLEEGRLDWVYNIIEGRMEQEDIILRQSTDLGQDREGFLLVPDMNWDRKTMTSLRILGLVERRDLWSLRDLRRGDVNWLRRTTEKIEESIEKKYRVERDTLKLYVHCKCTLVTSDTCHSSLGTLVLVMPPKPYKPHD